MSIKPGAVLSTEMQNLYLNILFKYSVFQAVFFICSNVFSKLHQTGKLLLYHSVMAYSYHLYVSKIRSHLILTIL